MSSRKNEIKFQTSEWFCDQESLYPDEVLCFFVLPGHSEPNRWELIRDDTNLCLNRIFCYPGLSPPFYAMQNFLGCFWGYASFRIHFENENF